MHNTVEFSYQSKGSHGEFTWIIEQHNETKELYDDLAKVFDSHPEGENDQAILEFNEVFLRHGGAMKLTF